MDSPDFTITQINNVIHRKSTVNWHMHNIHFPNDHVIVIALEGKAIYDISGTPISINKNDIIVFAPGVNRSGCSDPKDPWEFISINFHLEQNRAAAHYFSEPYRHLPHIGDILRERFLSTAQAWAGKDLLYCVQCRYLLLSILHDILSEQLRPSHLPHVQELEAARQYIQANFRQEITIEDLSRSAGLSISHFRKLFKDTYGSAPMQYITALRINTAKDLLLSGSANITEAAALSGFHDIYYFSTLFKKKTGLSPSAYLKKTLR